MSISPERPQLLNYSITKEIPTKRVIVCDLYIIEYMQFIGKRHSYYVFLTNQQRIFNQINFAL